MLQTPYPTDNDKDDLEFAVHSLVWDLSESESRFAELHSTTESNIQQQFHEYITTGWPSDISSVFLSPRTFWNFCNNLHTVENLFSSIIV